MDEMRWCLKFALKSIIESWKDDHTKYAMYICILASLVVQTVKNLPVMWETWVWSLGWQDSLEKGMATHSSILAWRIPVVEETGGIQSTGLQRAGHDWATKYTYMYILYMCVDSRGRCIMATGCSLYLCVFENFISSVQSLSHVQLFVTPWTAARQVSLSITNAWNLPKFMSILSVMPSSHLILCRPLLLMSPIPPNIRGCSNESTSHEVAKVLEFQLQHQSFQWTPRTDFL